MPGSPYFLREGLSGAWGSPTVGGLATGPQGLTCFCLPSTAITRTYHHATFFFQGVGLGFSDLNAGPHVLPSKYFEEV